jgi:DNA repair protein RecO (recombination protein O)
MPPNASDALVLRTHNLGETSKVVVLLTRDRGKLRAIAKGARGKRSRYRSALEPLSEVHVELYGRQGAELYRMGSCELIHSAFRTASRGVETSLACSYFAELIDDFSPEGVAEDHVYRLTQAVLRAAEGGVDGEVLARYLEAWLLKLHGLFPSLNRCASCGAVLSTEDLVYHAPAHGFVCDCLRMAPTGPRLSRQAKAFLTRTFTSAPDALQDCTAPPDLERFQQELIARHLERDLRSLRVWQAVKRGTVPS